MTNWFVMVSCDMSKDEVKNLVERAGGTLQDVTPVYNVDSTVTFYAEGPENMAETLASIDESVEVYNNSEMDFH